MSTNPNTTDPNLQDGFLSQHGKHFANKVNETREAGSFIARYMTRIQDTLSRQGQIFTRFGFGVQAIPTRFIVSSTIMIMLAAFMSGSTLAIMFSLGYFLLACSHRIHSMIREGRGHIQDSHADGTPYLENWACKIGEWLGSMLRLVILAILKMLRPFLEPAIVMTASGMFLLIAHENRPEHIPQTQFFWGSAFSVYLAVVSFAMLIQQIRSKRAATELTLNARDSRLRNEAIARLQQQELEQTIPGIETTTWDETVVHADHLVR